MTRIESVKLDIACFAGVPDDNVCGSLLQYVEPVSTGDFDVLCYLSSEEEDSSLIGTECEDLLEELATGIADSAALLAAGGNFGCWRSSKTLDDSGRDNACQPNYQHTGRLSDCPHCTYFFVCINYPEHISFSTSTEPVSARSTTLPPSPTVTPTQGQL